MKSVKYQVHETRFHVWIGLMDINIVHHIERNVGVDSFFVFVTDLHEAIEGMPESIHFDNMLSERDE